MESRSDLLGQTVPSGATSEWLCTPSVTGQDRAAASPAGQARPSAAPSSSSDFSAVKKRLSRFHGSCCGASTTGSGRHEGGTEQSVASGDGRHCLV